MAQDTPSPAIAPLARRRLPPPCRPEDEVVHALSAAAARAIHWPDVVALARPWVEAVRDKPAPFWALESLLREYPISSPEGLALMRLAEALLRVPDAETAIALTADQLGRGDFGASGESAARTASPHRMIASLSASAISLSKRFLPDAEAETGLFRRLGAQTVVAATVRAIQLLGRQFVLGRSIGEALGEAASTRRAQPGLRFSYDMLGEGARTERDAERYLASYLDAIRAIAKGRGAGGPEAADGISIKLSAIFSRYEEAQRERVFAELVPRVRQLVEVAAEADLNLTIDAEESDRLELSLDVFEVLARGIAASHPQWRGFGLAIQAYQTRAIEVVDEVARIGRSLGLRFMARLVKGAYWDGEIKRAQEQGLAGYPVFTEKAHTDTSYLACAAALIGHADVIYPQFATHNAGTIAAILQMAEARGARFEMQRLHGMGEGIYREVSRYIPSGPMTTTPPAPPAQARGLKGGLMGSVPVRIYAPVGEHRDLLAYLVRRLLENGANSSFVHQLSDASVDVETLLASPLAAQAPAVPLPLPVDLFRAAPSGSARANSLGVDLADVAERAVLERAVAATRVEAVAEANAAEVETAVGRALTAFSAWNATPVAARAAVLRRAADLLEARLPEFCGLLVAEAGKTLGDCVAEVREAVDFCRYYADEAERRLASQALPGPTGESNELHLHGRGVFACISPWNFPLAIFGGQVAAALVAGNAVVAKPAEQTPAVALRMVALLHEAGVPSDALLLVHGPGETVGAALVADARIGGVCFTGSLPVAQAINRVLAARRGAIVPLIAETGGVNAMIVDSSALPEQVVDAVVQSAFRSAGQRCSALRLLCVHESVADAVMEMIRGALAELRVGEPARYATDVGPLIDAEAYANIAGAVDRLRHEGRLVGEAPLSAEATAGGRFVAPVAFEVPGVASVSGEVFGPVLQVVRWGGDVDAVIAAINALGYGLTLGIQTRIDSRALRLAAAARIGNVYVNRNMIGAVVGVQPFGGEGLSGTGPKAGGPHYLPRFCAEQVVTINTAAAGGNVALLAGPQPSSVHG
jgi:RHH-type proline utilization regulon transcriptional repressor/proline dehydrogenase/delta 1-pyrroline-5-carboxylate dehydrogenase